MSEIPVQPEPPIDLDVLHADDALLDALGRGAPAPADDELAAVLAAWRAELATDEASAEPTTGPATEPAAEEDTSVAEVVPISRARSPRAARLAVAAAVLAVVAGGTGVAAVQATPGSPLWPITHLVNPDRVDVLDAESAIADARRAVTEGRTTDAQRLVDKADALVSRVRDPGEAARLRAELDEVRHLLGTVNTPATPSGAGSAGPAPGTTPAPGAGTGSGTAGSNGQPTPAPTGTGGHTPGPLVPSLPVPTSVPPLLPSLPIVGGL